MTNLILCPDINSSPDLTFLETTCSEMIWENGDWINDKEYDLSKIQFIFENSSAKKMTDYAVSDFGCSIVSERLKNVFDSEGIDNIQYFKTSIIQKKGTPALDGFYIANIIGLADCIDLENSEMDSDLEDDNITIIYSVEKLVLKKYSSEKLIFRLKHFTRVILITENLKEKLIQLDITGIKLISPEKWDGFNGEHSI